MNNWTIKKGYVANKKFATAKAKPPAKGAKPAPNTNINWNDKLKFDAKFDVDTPTISFSMDRLKNMFEFDAVDEILKKPQKAPFSFGKKKAP